MECFEDVLRGAWLAMGISMPKSLTSWFKAGPNSFSSQGCVCIYVIRFCCFDTFDLEKKFFFLPFFSPYVVVKHIFYTQKGIKIT